MAQHDDALAARLRALYAEGSESWPGISLSAEVLAQHLAALVPAGPAGVAALDGLAAADLFLACACAHGDVVALRAFTREHLDGLALRLHRGGESQAVADEIAQRLRVKLLVGGPSLQPRIASYAGRGSLSSFLRVLAAREVVSYHRESVQRRERPHEPAALTDQNARLLQDLDSRADPELAYLRDRHRAAFQTALGAALQGLSPEERNLLRLTTVEGLRGEQVAALFSVTRSTVVRWLAAARHKVWQGTRERLHQQLGIAEAEFESLARVLRSELELSVARLLRE